MFFHDAYAETAKTNQDTIAIQNSESTPKATDTSSGWTSIIPMILIFVVFYFLLIRPQEKRRRQKEALVKSVKRGEEVLTASGIFGTVTKVNDDQTAELEIAKDTHIKILKSSIADILNRTDTTLSDTKKPNTTKEVTKKEKSTRRAKSS